MASCLYTTVCVHDTGFPLYDDTYVRTGTYNDNSYYIGQTNGYVIFFSPLGYWCLSDYISGECFLTGKSPCTSVCPDFCDDYYTRGVCPPPEPPPVDPCNIIDFDAIFNCDVPIPTPPPTPQCGDIITTSATSPTSIIELESNTNNGYSIQGTIFHDPFNFDGTSPGNIYLAVSTTQPVWRRATVSDGPLNRSGLWAVNSFPEDTWLGFSVCVNAPETKTYWIGIAADNVFKISIDGNEILNTYNGPYDYDVCSCNFSFIYWHVYPFTITSGNHVVDLFGLNRSGINAAFGCEIYDNTIDELTGATQVSDLNIIFTSSGQLSATTVQTLSGDYLSSGFTCPSGYVFDPCTISCFTVIPPCTPTATPTPTSTVFCPLSVNATILSFTPTQTPTPSITPSVAATITRDCGLLGDVTFNTINSTIDCPSSLEFQDCYNGSTYYTTNSLSRPEGGGLEKFMIYQALVDGVRKCISYVGVNQNIIGVSNISFISNLIGYSNLGQCVSCLGILTPTPTPTPSITPTITLTSTSNKPEPPPSSNTPTPTKSRTILYYTYQDCESNTRICQPVLVIGNMTTMQIFKTGPGGPYGDKCWKLMFVNVFCGTQNPNYNTIVSSVNVFTSIIPTLYNDCEDCSKGINPVNNSSQQISPTPTRTVTPTKTKAPQIQACKPHTIIISNYSCNVCYYPNYSPLYSIPTNTTVYSPSDSLAAGVQIFSNSTCTSPIPAGQYIKAISSGGGALTSTLLTAGQGVLSNYSCSSCY
jgi:hypothetical protein